jgi:hypothetical protein
MKKIQQKFFTALALFGLTFASSATVIVNQTAWPDGNNTIQQTNQNLPISLGWQFSTKANYWGTNSTLVISNIVSSTTLWAYLADSNAPISLSVGQMLRATATLIFTNVVDKDALQLVAATSRGLRWGLVNAGEFQKPLTNGTGSGLRSMPGYAQNMDFANAFLFDGPLQVQCFTNINLNQGLFGSTADAIAVGDNGGGHSNDPAFTDGIPYTFIMTVSRTAAASVDISTTITGPTLLGGGITQTVTDTNYAFSDFDTFGIRPASSTSTCKFITMTSFKAETLPIVPPAPQFTKITKQGSNVVLTWNSTPGYSYSVLRTNDLRTFLTNWPAAIVTAYPPGYAQGSSLSVTDTTATATLNFYRLSSP